MTSAQMKNTLAGIEENVAVVYQRCEILRANLEKTKIQAKTSRSAAVEDGLPAIKTQVSSTNHIIDEGSSDTEDGSAYRDEQSASLLLPLIFPEENPGYLDQRSESKETDYGNANALAALQKLQEFLLGFPVVRRMASLSKKISEPTTASTEMGTGISEQRTFADESSSEKLATKSQFEESDETSFHTEDHGCYLKDDFFSADDRPPSSCKNICSGNENDDSAEESYKNIDVLLPISARLKVKKPRLRKARRARKCACRTDADRACSARVLRTPRAGNLKPIRVARSSVERADKKPTATVHLECMKPSKESVMIYKPRRRPARRTLLKALPKHNRKQPRKKCKPRSQSSSNNAELTLSNKSWRETIDPPNVSTTTEETVSTEQPTIGPSSVECDCIQSNEVYQHNPLTTRLSGELIPAQKCSLTNEATSTNQLIDELSTFLDKQVNSCSSSQSILEQRSAGTSDIYPSTLDEYHSYEKPTLSSQLKRVERRLSTQDVRTQSTRRKEHPFVVATATSQSHNVTLFSREKIRENSRPGTSNRSTSARRTQSKCGGTVELNRVASCAASVSSATAPASAGCSRSVSGRSHPHEENFHLNEGTWGEDMEPLSYSRQVCNVVERLRTEMVELATKRAIATATATSTCNIYPNPSFLTPADHGIMRAKLKWSARVARASEKKSIMTSDECLHKLDYLDKKLQDKEDEIYVIVTLCEEVEELRQKLNALHRRLSLHSITKVEPVLREEKPAPAQAGRGRRTSSYDHFRFRGSCASAAPGKSRRALAQTCFRSKSAGLTNAVL